MDAPSSLVALAGSNDSSACRKDWNDAQEESKRLAGEDKKLNKPLAFAC